MDVNLGLFSQKLRRLLEGEEEMLLDAAKEQIQNLYAEIESVISSLKKYEDDMCSLQVMEGNSCPDISAILKEINYFCREAEEVIDTLIISFMQQKSEHSSKEICDAFQGLQSEIIDIKQRMLEVQPNQTGLINKIKSLQAKAGGSSLAGFQKMDMEGLKDEMEELLDLLIEGEYGLSAIVIVDTLKLEKTAFAAEAYNNIFVKNYFDCRVWVSLFMKDYKEMLDEIIKSVMPPSRLNEIINLDYEPKRSILSDYLRNKRFLIVLDEADDAINSLEEVIPNHENGSRVLITLTDSECLRSFELEDGSSVYTAVPLGGPMRVTSGGLPYVIFYHGSDSLEDNMEDVVYEQLITQSAFYSLLPIHLKPCVFYFSVFPEHFEISTRQLYQLWIAEGFIPDNNEATAEQYLRELIDRDLVQVKKRRAGGTIKTCSLRTIIKLSAIVVSERTEFTGLHGHNEDELLEKCRRLSVLADLTDFVSSNYSKQHLQSLLQLSSSPHHLDPVDCNFLSEIKLLRLLDLRTLVLEQYPIGIENLFLLRYLKLNIPSLKSLPPSLGNLLNLYTLDMPSSYIDYTPNDIWKMNKLRHLNFGYITLNAPERTEICSSLDNLNFISALHPKSCTPEILGRLPKLQTLRIYGDLNSYQSVISSGLCKLSCLESLKLANKSSQPPSIVIGNEYKYLRTLTHLSLSNSALKQDPMPTLEELPHLQVLKLKQNSYLGRKLACHSRRFPCLKTLHLKSMLWLEEWIMGKGAMPKLESLIINPCAYLGRLPEELWNIRSFKNLELWWPRPELKRKLRDFEDKQQYAIQIYPYGM